MNVEHWWNDTDRAKLKYPSDRLLPLPVHPPQISFGLA